MSIELTEHKRCIKVDSPLAAELRYQFTRRRRLRWFDIWVNTRSKAFKRSVDKDGHLIVQLSYVLQGADGRIGLIERSEKGAFGERWTKGCSIMTSISPVKWRTVVDHWQNVVRELGEIVSIEQEAKPEIVGSVLRNVRKDGEEARERSYLFVVYRYPVVVGEDATAPGGRDDVLVRFV
ncbi:MAG: hypothetical protein ACF8LL_13160, partial [Phycisphaerales bacterium]